MGRTTLNIDTPILEEVKRIKEEENLPLGRIVSDLLASALAERKHDHGSNQELQWVTRSMGTRVDLEDKEELYRVLDGETDP